jgi:hypothetical protein
MKKRTGRRSAQSKAKLSGAQRTLTNQITKMVKAELANSVRQIESHANLLVSLNGGIALPSMRGWPISPDFGIVLTEVLDATPYEFVVEFGSGVSTFILAALLGNPNAYSALQSHVALEHLERYQQHTLQQLGRLPDLKRTQVWHCPLVDAHPTDETGATYSHYDCTDRLRQHLQSLAQPVSKVLALVDGPPGSTGRWARYPAVPLLMQLLPHADLHILLDDHHRLDEKETGQAWVKLLESQHYQVEVQTPLTEKGALLIKATKLSATLA